MESLKLTPAPSSSSPVTPPVHLQLLAGGSDTSKLGQGDKLVAGGVAGAVFWASVYPADVIKSMMQVDDYK